MKKTSAGNLIFNVFLYAFFTLVTLAFVIPLWSVITVSFMSETERLTRGMFVLYPFHIDLSAYRFILGRNSQIYSAYLVTLYRASFGTFISMLTSVMLAYGLSKKTLPFRFGLTFAIYFTTMFGGGLIPTFLWVRALGLYNNLLVLVLPGLVSAWNMLLLRNFFAQIPDALEEAAFIDGATPAQVLFRIMIPLSLPAIATVSLFYCVGHWNAWFDGMLYISNPRMVPLQNVLRNIVLAANITDMQGVNELPPPLEPVRNATIVVAMLPIMMVYLAAQKYFIRGVIVGGIKG